VGRVWWDADAHPALKVKVKVVIRSNAKIFGSPYLKKYNRSEVEALRVGRV